MTEKDIYLNKNTPRENFLMSLLNKVIREYKNLLEETRRTKPLKILKINKLSSVPGETEFLVHVSNKRCILPLTAAQIIRESYNLKDFSNFQADMIRNAAQGTLIEFLKLTEKEPSYYIVSKKLDKELQQYQFTIATPEKLFITRTASEIANDKSTLNNLGLSDVYDIAYTQGSESILREKTALMMAKEIK